MSELKANCYMCGVELSDEPVESSSFRWECFACGADLHVCRMCSNYAPGHYNDCAESQAERVLEKEKANFCDWFKVGTLGADKGDDKADALAKLEALFK